MFLFFCFAGCQKGTGATGSAIPASLYHHSAPSVAKVTRLRGNMPRNQRRGNLSTLLTLQRTDIRLSLPNSAAVLVCTGHYTYVRKKVSVLNLAFCTGLNIPPPSFLGALKRIAKSCPSISPSSCDNSARTGWFFTESDMCVFFGNLERKFKFH